MPHAPQEEASVACGPQYEYGIRLLAIAKASDAERESAEMSLIYLVKSALLLKAAAQ
jgi:hypothetical protein